MNIPASIAFLPNEVIVKIFQNMPPLRVLDVLLQTRVSRLIPIVVALLQLPFVVYNYHSQTDDNKFLEERQMYPQLVTGSSLLIDDAADFAAILEAADFPVLIERIVLNFYLSDEVALFDLVRAMKLFQNFTPYLKIKLHNTLRFNLTTFIQTFFASIPSLKELEITSNGIDFEVGPIKGLEVLTCWIHGEVICIECGDLKELNVRANRGYLELNDPGRLESLAINDATLTADMDEVAKIRRLSLRFTRSFDEFFLEKIDKNTIQKLEVADANPALRSGNFENLTVLNISGFAVERYNFHCPKLKKLTMSECGISSVDGYNWPPSIKFLDINSNSVKNINGLRLKTPHLEYLDVSCNPILLDKSTVLPVNLKEFVAELILVTEINSHTSSFTPPCHLETLRVTKLPYKIGNVRYPSNIKVIHIHESHGFPGLFSKNGVDLYGLNMRLVKIQARTSQVLHLKPHSIEHLDCSASAINGIECDGVVETLDLSSTRVTNLANIKVDYRKVLTLNDLTLLEAKDYVFPASLEVLIIEGCTNVMFSNVRFESNSKLKILSFVGSSFDLSRFSDLVLQLPLGLKVLDLSRTNISTLVAEGEYKITIPETLTIFYGSDTPLVGVKALEGLRNLLRVNLSLTRIQDQQISWICQLPKRRYSALLEKGFRHLRFSDNHRADILPKGVEAVSYQNAVLVWLEKLPKEQELIFQELMSNRILGDRRSSLLHG